MLTRELHAERTKRTPARTVRGTLSQSGSLNYQFDSHGHSTRGRTMRRCACGGSCPMCRHGRASTRGRSDGGAADRHELEANRVADAVVAMSPRAGSVRELTTRTAFVSGVSDLGSVMIHADSRAAEAAAAIGARAFTRGRDVYFGQNEFSDTDAGQHLVAHELAHVAQQRKIGPRLQRQPVPVVVQVGIAAAILERAADGPRCTPFSSPEEADNVELALETLLLPAETTLFGGEVANLWADFLSRQPGDSVDPVVFDSSSSAVVQGFQNSADTRAYQEDFLMPAVWAVLPDLCATLPVDDTVDVPVEQFFPENILAHDVIWADPFDLPANIAGESGPSDAGLDSRRLSGFMTVTRMTDQTGHTIGIRVEPNFHLTVKDTIDFCPGNLGAAWQTTFTIPLSRLEEHGAAYDRPFVVEFDMLIAAADAPADVIAECDAAAKSSVPADLSELGLPEPDCKVRANDVFLLGAAYHDPERPECSFAQIHERKDHSRNRLYRADYPLPATPCTEGDQKSQDFWLGGQWRILDITTTSVIVLNACGEEETLGVEPGFKPPPSPGVRTVDVPESNFGPGTVELLENCHRVIFRRKDGSLVKEYVLETWSMPGAEDMTVYVPTEGEKIPYPPLDLSRSLRVHLAGDACGEPFPEAAMPEPEEEVF